MNLFAEFARRLAHRPDRADVTVGALIATVVLWASLDDGYGWWSPVLAFAVALYAWALTRLVMVLAEAWIREREG